VKRSNTSCRSRNPASVQFIGARVQLLHLHCYSISTKRQDELNSAKMNSAIGMLRYLAVKLTTRRRVEESLARRQDTADSPSRSPDSISVFSMNGLRCRCCCKLTGHYNKWPDRVDLYCILEKLYLRPKRCYVTTLSKLTFTVHSLVYLWRSSIIRYRYKRRTGNVRRLWRGVGSRSEDDHRSKLRGDGSVLDFNWIRGTLYAVS